MNAYYTRQRNKRRGSYAVPRHAAASPDTMVDLTLNSDDDSDNDGDDDLANAHMMLPRLNISDDGHFESLSPHLVTSLVGATSRLGRNRSKEVKVTVRWSTATAITEYHKQEVVNSKTAIKSSFTKQKLSELCQKDKKATTKFDVNEKIFAWDRGVLYEAKVIKCKQDGVDIKYHVHYLGYKRSHDKWLDGHDMMEDTPSNRTYYEDSNICQKRSMMVNSIVDNNQVVVSNRKRKEFEVDPVPKQPTDRVPGRMPIEASKLSETKGEDETDRVFHANERIFAWDEGHLYNANVVKCSKDENGGMKYLVHYSGYARTHDKWLSDLEMIKDNPKGREFYEDCTTWSLAEGSTRLMEHVSKKQTNGMRRRNKKKAHIHPETVVSEKHCDTTISITPPLPYDDEDYAMLHERYLTPRVREKAVLAGGITLRRQYRARVIDKNTKGFRMLKKKVDALLKKKNHREVYRLLCQLRNYELDPRRTPAVFQERGDEEVAEVLDLTKHDDNDGEDGVGSSNDCIDVDEYITDVLLVGVKSKGDGGRKMSPLSVSSSALPDIAPSSSQQVRAVSSEGTSTNNNTITELLSESDDCREDMVACTIHVEKERPKRSPPFINEYFVRPKAFQGVQISCAAIEEFETYVYSVIETLSQGAEVSCRNEATTCDDSSVDMRSSSISSHKTRTTGDVATHTKINLVTETVSQGTSFIHGGSPNETTHHDGSSVNMLSSISPHATSATNETANHPRVESAIETVSQGTGFSFDSTNKTTHPDDGNANMMTSISPHNTSTSDETVNHSKGESPVEIASQGTGFSYGSSSTDSTSYDDSSVNMMSSILPHKTFTTDATANGPRVDSFIETLSQGIGFSCGGSSIGSTSHDDSSENMTSSIPSHTTFITDETATQSRVGIMPLELLADTSSHHDIKCLPSSTEKSYYRSSSMIGMSDESDEKQLKCPKPPGQRTIDECRNYYACAESTGQPSACSDKTANEAIPTPAMFTSHPRVTLEQFPPNDPRDAIKLWHSTNKSECQSHGRTGESCELDGKQLRWDDIIKPPGQRTMDGCRYFFVHAELTRQSSTTHNDNSVNNTSSISSDAAAASLPSLLPNTPYVVPKLLHSSTKNKNWTCARVLSLVGRHQRCGICKERKWKRTAFDITASTNNDAGQHWTCHCGNKATKSRCGRCRRWRDGKQKSRPSWECHTCLISNPGSKNKCEGCQQWKHSVMKKSTTPMVGTSMEERVFPNGPDRPSPLWEDSNCNILNNLGPKRKYGGCGEWKKTTVKSISNETAMTEEKDNVDGCHQNDRNNVKHSFRGAMDGLVMPHCSNQRQVEAVAINSDVTEHPASVTATTRQTMGNGSKKLHASTDINTNECVELWTCDCGKEISTNKSRCAECFCWRGGKRPTTDRWKKEKKKKPLNTRPSWECSHCNISNPGSKIKCQGCHGLKRTTMESSTKKKARVTSQIKPCRFVIAAFGFCCNTGTRSSSFPVVPKSEREYHQQNPDKWNDVKKRNRSKQFEPTIKTPTSTIIPQTRIDVSRNRLNNCITLHEDWNKQVTRRKKGKWIPSGHLSGRWKAPEWADAKNVSSHSKHKKYPSCRKSLLSKLESLVSKSMVEMKIKSDTCGQAGSLVNQLSLQDVIFSQYLKPSNGLLRNAHSAVRNLLPIGDCEDWAVVELARRYYNYWRPKKTKVILLAESHAFTTTNRALHGPGLDERVLRDNYFGPRGFISLVYCLAYGENDALEGKAKDKVNKGTPQFWTLLAACSSRGVDHVATTNSKKTFSSSFAADLLKGGNLPVEERLKAKLEVLEDLRDRGVWLLDASVFGWYMSQPQEYKRSAVSNEVHRKVKSRPPKELKTPSLVLSWELFTKHVIREVAEEGNLKLLIPIGMEVEAALTHERMEDAIRGRSKARVTDTFPAPNAWIPGGYGPFHAKLAALVDEAAPRNNARTKHDVPINETGVKTEEIPRDDACIKRDISRDDGIKADDVPRIEDSVKIENESMV